MKANKKNFILLLMLSSCAADVGYKHWYKNGKTQDEFAKVKYQCLHETGQENAFINAASDAFFTTCMNAHGYYLSKNDVKDN